MLALTWRVLSWVLCVQECWQVRLTWETCLCLSALRWRTLKYTAACLPAGTCSARNHSFYSLKTKRKLLKQSQRLCNISKIYIYIYICSYSADKLGHLFLTFQVSAEELLTGPWAFLPLLFFHVSVQHFCEGIYSENKEKSHCECNCSTQSEIYKFSSGKAFPYSKFN